MTHMQIYSFVMPWGLHSAWNPSDQINDFLETPVCCKHKWTIAMNMNINMNKPHLWMSQWETEYGTVFTAPYTLVNTYKIPCTWHALCRKMPLVSAWFSVLACSRVVSRFPGSNAQLVNCLFPCNDFPCGFAGSIQFKPFKLMSST